MEPVVLAKPSDGKLGGSLRTRLELCSYIVLLTMLGLVSQPCGPPLGMRLGLSTELLNI